MPRKTILVPWRLPPTRASPFPSASPTPPTMLRLSRQLLKSYIKGGGAFMTALFTSVSASVCRHAHTHTHSNTATHTHTHAHRHPLCAVHLWGVEPTGRGQRQKQFHFTFVLRHLLPTHTQTAIHKPALRLWAWHYIHTYASPCSPYIAAFSWLHLLLLLLVVVSCDKYLLLCFLMAKRFATLLLPK